MMNQKKVGVLPCVLLAALCALAAGPGGGGPGGGGGNQPGGGGGNQPGGGGASGAFVFDTFITDPTTTDGCIVYGTLLTGYVDGATSITIPSTVTAIAPGALAGNTSLLTLNAAAASKLTELPEAFASGCTSLLTVTLPSSITTLEASCFTMDGVLRSFSGTGVTDVGKYAFYGCTSLVFRATFPFKETGTAAVAGTSYLTSDGSICRSEAQPIVSWLAANGSVASSLTQPTSYSTANMKTWLSNAANLEAYLYGDERTTNTTFAALTVSGTNFVYQTTNRATPGVVNVSFQAKPEFTDAWTTIDLLGSIYTPGTTNAFAHLVYDLPW